MLLMIVLGQRGHVQSIIPCQAPLVLSRNGLVPGCKWFELFFCDQYFCVFIVIGDLLYYRFELAAMCNMHGACGSWIVCMSSSRDSINYVLWP